MKLCDYPRTKIGGCIESNDGMAWYTFGYVTVNGMRKYIALYHDENMPDGLLTDSANTTSELVSRIKSRHPLWIFHI